MGLEEAFEGGWFSERVGLVVSRERVGSEDLGGDAERREFLSS